MNPDEYEELRNAILKDTTYLNALKNPWNTGDTIGTWKGQTINIDDLRDLFNEPKVKYKEIGDAGNWHIVKVYDREVRNWLKEQELHLWSQNTDNSYDVHNSLWCMLCLRWEQ